MTPEATPHPRPLIRRPTTLGGGLHARRRRRLLPLAVLAPAAAALAVVVPAHPGAAGTAAPSRVASAPAPVAAPVAAAPVAVAAEAPSGTHIVAAGETLSGIAADHATTVDAVVAANGLADPDLILPGTTLALPAGGGATGAGSATGASTAPTPNGSTAGLPARLQQSPERLAHRPTFARWAAANGVPVDLLEAMTWLESGWQVGKVSPDGAVGIGQLMPGTTEHMELLIGADLDPYVAEDNIRMSARYLRWLLARTASTGDALAGYYQGLASVQAHGRFPDTEVYVQNILALRARF